jgi:hypothetical protein
MLYRLLHLNLGGFLWRGKLPGASQADALDVPLHVFVTYTPDICARDRMLLQALFACHNRMHAHQLHSTDVSGAFSTPTAGCMHAPMWRATPVHYLSLTDSHLLTGAHPHCTGWVLCWLITC